MGNELTESFLCMFPASTANWLSRKAGAFVFFSAHLEGENACKLKGTPVSHYPC